jgi:RNA polymerase sigma factor (sigma-70 family)
VQEQTDRELVTLARAGDKEAFGELLARYQSMALRIAQGMVRQEEVARELVQEAWLAAYLSLHQLRDGERFRSWLYSIVLNVCRSYVRDQKGTTLSLEVLLGGVRYDTVAFSDALIDPQEMAEAHELRQRMLRAVNALSPKERAVTLLFYCKQLSIREIAALLEISESAVKSRLFQARKRLRTSHKN